MRFETESAPETVFTGDAAIMYPCEKTKISAKSLSKLLTSCDRRDIIFKLEILLGVAQLVARYLGVVEAAGSSPVTQTKNSVENAQISTEFLFLCTENNK